MMFQDDKALRNEVFSKPMQRRMAMMLQNADRLFSIGWLRKRLWADLASRVQEAAASEYGCYAHVLQGDYESRFAWHFLSVCGKSLAEIKRKIDNAYDDGEPLRELLDDREELIREFARMQLSNTWEHVKDDDRSWRSFAHRMPFGEANRQGDINRFFDILDRISLITDIVCGKAAEYGLEVDYSRMGDLQQIPPELDTPRAHELWEAAQEENWVNEHLQPLLSRPLAALLADRMAEVLGIKAKWKVFETMWHRKNMRNDYNTALDQQQYDEYRKKFRRVIY